MNVWLNQNSHWLWPLIIFAIVSLLIGVYFLARMLKNDEKENLKKSFKQMEREDFLKESLRTIALACIQKQCEISEGCIRINYLIQSTPDLMSEGHDWSVFFEFGDKLKKFDTHGERDSLSKQITFEQDNERYQLEFQYEERFLAACKLLFERLEDRRWKKEKDELH